MKIAYQVFRDGKWVIFCMALLAGGAMGVVNLSATMHMTNHGVSNLFIGVNSTIFFLFIAIGSFLTNSRFRFDDLKYLILCGFFIAALSMVCFPLTSHLSLWMIVRALMGIGVGFYLVGAQTILHTFSTLTSRGIFSGLYTLCFSIGFVLGAFFGPVVYSRQPLAAFYLGAGIFCIASFLIWVKLPGIVLTTPYGKNNTVGKKISLPLYGIFSYGFAEATVVTLYPVYLMHKHVAPESIGYTIGSFVVGGLVGTVPFMYVADRMGKLRSLISCVTFGIFAIVYLMISGNSTYLLIATLCAGVGIAPLYPLMLSIIAAEVSTDELTSATSLFTTSYSIGCTAGPLLSSIFMESFGDDSLFLVCMVLFIILLLLALIQSFRPGAFAYKKYS